MRLKSKALFSLALSLSLTVFAKTQDQGFRICDDVDEPATLDPFGVFSEKVHTIIQQYSEGLLRFGPKGQIEASLAEKWERIDPLTFRFYLRRGVRFHNGEPFTAAAVKFSFERYVSPDTRYPGFPFVNSVAKVNILDDYTVDVITHYPDGLLLNRAAAFFHIVPANYFIKVGPAGFSDAPVGTGPFKFERWEKKKKIVLVKNPDYWAPGLPMARRIEFNFIPADQQFQALISGHIDLMTELPGTYTLRTMENPGTIVKKSPSLATTVLIINANPGSPLADKRVRRALAHAVAREDYIQYDAQGNATPLVSVTAKGSPGHNDALQPIPLDRAKASGLLEEAGYGGGKVLRLKLLAVNHSKRASGIIRKHFEDVGVIVDVEVVPETDVVPAFMRGGWDIALASLPNPMAHAYFPLSLLFYSKSPYSLLKNADVDRMLEEAIATTDPGVQEEKFQALDRYIHDEVLGIGIYQRLKTFGMSRRVAFTPSVTGMHYFTTARTGIMNTRKTAE